HPDALHDLERIFDAKFLEEMVVFEAADGEAALLEILQLLAARWDDVLVEAGDLHAAGFAVHALGNQLAHLGDGIARGASGGSGVLVGFSGLQLETEALKPSQARRLSGPRTRDPDRVGDDDRVRRKLFGVLSDCGLEVRTADFLLELPEK